MSVLGAGQRASAARSQRVGRIGRLPCQMGQDLVHKKMVVTSESNHIFVSLVTVPYLGTILFFVEMVVKV